MAIERSSPELSLAIQTASAAIRAMFKRQDEYTIDDAEFLPLVNCVTEGFHQAVVEHGVGKKDADDLAKDVEAVAFDVYLKTCQENDPGCTAEEVWRDFLAFMGKKKGKRPARN